jgi:hypothetical protein
MHAVGRKIFLSVALLGCLSLFCYSAVRSYKRLSLVLLLIVDSPQSMLFGEIAVWDGRFFNLLRTD